LGEGKGGQEGSFSGHENCRRKTTRERGTQKKRGKWQRGYQIPLNPTPKMKESRKKKKESLSPRKVREHWEKLSRRSKGSGGNIFRQMKKNDEKKCCLDAGPEEVAKGAGKLPGRKAGQTVKKRAGQIRKVAAKKEYPKKKNGCKGEISE